jgi:hypothetical protein
MRLALRQYIDTAMGSSRPFANLAPSTRAAPISKHGPKYLRWALFEAALNACKHPYYRDRYLATKRRLGRQRGPKVAQIDLGGSRNRSGRCSPAISPSLRQVPLFV